jgi:hypothetical protein
VSNFHLANAPAPQPTTRQFVNAGRSVRETSALPLPPRLNAQSSPRDLRDYRHTLRLAQPSDLSPVLHDQHLLLPWLDSGQGHGKLVNFSCRTVVSIQLPPTRNIAPRLQPVTTNIAGGPRMCLQPAAVAVNVAVRAL